MVGEGAAFDEDVVVFYGLDEVAVLEEIEAVADTLRAEFGGLADALVGYALGLTSMEHPRYRPLPPELLLHLPYHPLIHLEPRILILLHNVNPDDQVRLKRTSSVRKL